MAQKSDFTFETVLSTERNLNLLRRAREQGYFIRGYFVFTRHPNINVLRVQSRTEEGGHNVPIDKILKRYKLTMANLPELIKLCDICHVYDNTQELFRILKSAKRNIYFSPASFGPKKKLKIWFINQLKPNNLTIKNPPGIMPDGFFYITIADYKL